MLILPKNKSAIASLVRSLHQSIPQIARESLDNTIIKLTDMIVGLKSAYENKEIILNDSFYKKLRKLGSPLKAWHVKELLYNQKYRVIASNASIHLQHCDTSTILQLNFIAGTNKIKLGSIYFGKGAKEAEFMQLLEGIKKG